MKKSNSVRKLDKGPGKISASIYVRNASGPSEKSIKRQERACKSYAHLLGACNPHVFADAAAGSRVLGRPGLSTLLEKCGRGQFDILVVEDLNRLTRSAMDGFQIMDRLSKAGVKLHSVAERRVLGPVDFLRTNWVEKRGKTPRSATRKAGTKKPPAEE
jgi:DNA invertase Pin-like site-specific DNA recombinase